MLFEVGLIPIKKRTETKSTLASNLFLKFLNLEVILLFYYFIHFNRIFYFNAPSKYVVSNSPSSSEVACTSLLVFYIILLMLCYNLII